MPEMISLLYHLCRVFSWRRVRRFAIFHSSRTVPAAGWNKEAFDMRDELDARIWNEFHGQFSDDLSRLFQAVKVTFCKIAEINFRAPWRTTSSNC